LVGSRAGDALSAIGIVPIQLLHLLLEGTSFLAHGVVFLVVMMVVAVQVLAGQTCLDLHAAEYDPSSHPQQR
jgi:hypothetical protein